MSGAEILWDLDYRGDSSDKSFVNNVLGVYYDSDDADSYSVTGEGELAGMNLSFEFGSGSPYHKLSIQMLSHHLTVLLPGMEQEE